MATFQRTYQWTRRFFAVGRVRLCAAIPKSCTCRVLHEERLSAPCANIGLITKVQSPPKAKGTRSNRVGCAKFLSQASMIANRPGCHSALDVNVHRLEGDAARFAFGVPNLLGRPCKSDPDGAYFREVLIEVNLVLSLLPSPFTTAIMASEMPAAIKPYSMAVAPDSSVMNLRRVFIALLKAA
jgi:hypothetical protein